MRPYRGKSPMKVICVALLACLLVPALALAQEGAAAQGNLNTITGVTVRGGTVEIVGTKKPNFTTFTMTDPPRLVIDISEAVFSGVKEDITVGNGTITAIRTASYGSDESAIARVLIGFERDVDPDIQANGNALVVSVGGGGGAAVAAAKPSGPAAGTGTAPAGTGTGTAPAGTGTGTAPAGTGAGTGTAATPGTGADQAVVVAQADRQQQEKAAAQAAAAAQNDRQQQEKAVAQSTAAAQADRQQQEKAAAQAAAAAQADAEARKQAQAKADADRKAQEEATRVASQQAEQQRQQQVRAEKEAAAAAEKQRQQDEARAAADAKKRQQADEKARREAEAQAAADAKKRQQEEARAAVEDKKRAAAEERQRQREEAQASAEEKQRQREEARQARVAQAERPAPRRAAPEQGGGDEVSSRRKTMTRVDFRQDSGVARVVVRTNEPVRYTVSEGASEVVLELENTRIAESNNTLALDTSFFNTAVASVAPKAGPSSTVRVAIKLKAQVPYQTRQDGNELSIEFQRPSGR
ncbi:AMIN domain-containing protein [Archangium sp.]|uniref:AMIN domain-containing protein n=1 Tax=Archangium sp. TaxID=1872627 RepID=UPI00389A6619